MLESTLEGLNPLSLWDKYAFQQVISMFSSLDVQILKYDILTKSSLIWEEEHCQPSESVFVPTPDAKEEDDGKTRGRGATHCTLPVITSSDRDNIWGQWPRPHHTAEGVFETQVCMNTELQG